MRDLRRLDQLDTGLPLDRDAVFAAVRAGEIQAWQIAGRLMIDLDELRGRFLLDPAPPAPPRRPHRVHTVSAMVTPAERDALGRQAQTQGAASRSAWIRDLLLDQAARPLPLPLLAPQPGRTVPVTTAVTAAERATCTAAAVDAGLRCSRWARAVLLAALADPADLRQ